MIVRLGSNQSSITRGNTLLQLLKDAISVFYYSGHPQHQKKKTKNFIKGINQGFTDCPNDKDLKNYSNLKKQKRLFSIFKYFKLLETKKELNHLFDYGCSWG